MLVEYMLVYMAHGTVCSAADEQGEPVKENMVRVHRVPEDQDRRQIPMDIRLPKKEFDSLNVFFRNANSNQPIRIDNINAWYLTTDQLRRMYSSTSCIYSWSVIRYLRSSSLAFTLPKTRQ